MHRTFTALADTNGNAVVSIMPNNRAMEWDIYQISISTRTFNMSCEAIVRHAGAFRCQSPQGSLDTATGPPDLVLQANEELTVSFSSVLANDTAIVSIWYNENMAGTTVSLAH